MPLPNASSLASYLMTGLGGISVVSGLGLVYFQEFLVGIIFIAIGIAILLLLVRMGNQFGQQLSSQQAQSSQLGQASTHSQHGGIVTYPPVYVFNPPQTNQIPQSQNQPLSSTITCPFCGKKINNDSIFCNYCGNQLNPQIAV
jgi:predicted lipid-binding transport protein (Tim44 family)